MEQTAQGSFELALGHLERVQLAWDVPTDWANLSTYGFYCLEASVVAAALHLGRERPGGHFEKQQEASYLADQQGLPEIGDLLVDLNAMRKHEAYGDVDPPEDLDSEDIAVAIERYVESVRELLSP